AAAESTEVSGVGSRRLRALRSFPTRRSSDLAEHFALRGPAIDRQAEGRFSDEGMAAHGLEGGAGAVWLDLVVAGSYPDLTAILQDRKSTRLNSSHVKSSYAVFCLKKKTTASA